MMWPWEGEASPHAPPGQHLTPVGASCPLSCLNAEGTRTSQVRNPLLDQTNHTGGQTQDDASCRFSVQQDDFGFYGIPSCSWKITRLFLILFCFLCFVFVCSIFCVMAPTIGGPAASQAPLLFRGLRSPELPTLITLK